MIKGFNYIKCLRLCIAICVTFIGAFFSAPVFGQASGSEPDSGEVELPFEFDDNRNPFGAQGSKNSLFLNTPSNIKSEVQYDPTTGQYRFDQKIGNSDFRPPSYMDFDEYLKYTKEKTVVDYWAEKKETENEFNQENPFRPQLQIESKTFDRIFGGNTVDIRPSGSAELRFGVRTSKTENPAIPVKQRSVTTFDFQQNIQINLIGNIGDKLKVTTNYNTQATFDFENQIKLDYTGYEDEILQDIELGNVSMPLNSSLITGSQTLFGIKTKMKFGKLDVTTVLSQQRGKKSEIQVRGGAQIKDFEVKADNYEDNRHFFLAHYFRDIYEEAVGSPPLLNTGVNITKIEVWVTNTRNVADNVRNLIAFQDLGEGNFLDRPDGRRRIYNKNYVADADPQILAGRTIDGSYEANNLYTKIANLPGIRNYANSTNLLSAQEGLDPRLDYNKIELARKLNENEYVVQPQLGYISLNQQLQPNQVLAVAFQYTYRGQVYQVGEFSTDGLEGTSPLILKMLKSNQLNTRIPLWDLMMKNVYNIGAYQVQKEGFELQLWYMDQETGLDINYIPDGAINNQPLLMVLGLDKLDVNQKPFADGYFDFISSPQITINPNNGRIYFPLLEPFGSSLRAKFDNPEIADKYAFDSLYTRTQADAKVLYPGKNRFSLKGLYQSSNSSEIMLNALNVPEGSVVVSAGGRTLTENTDYTVDYTLGRVRIINQGILESGTPISVSLESNELFAIQQKNLIASRFDYKFNDDLAIGGTIMRLSERPITQKVNIGNEPMANVMWGADFNYKTESQFVTSLIDKIPFIDTKQKSTFTFSGEFAQLIPGHSKAIGKNGNSYIDDFEGSQSAIDIRTIQMWHLASTPQLQPNLLPSGTRIGQLEYGFNRAKLAWYVIDPLFFRNNALTPQHIQDDPDLQSNHYMREVLEMEVFPERDLPVGQPNNIPVLDLAYYPQERGPYNYDANSIQANGELANPDENWGGIMRRIDQNDFEAANIEFIQFWIMDPFHPDNGIDEGDYPNSVNYNHEGGELYFNLGNISEDVLNDGLKSFENGLPIDANLVADTSFGNFTIWGRVPDGQQLVQAFDNDVTTREFQDVGLDGLRNQEEKLFFGDFLQNLQTKLPANIYQTIEADPSADDYNFFRDDDYDANQTPVLERYKKYNGLEGNSPTNEQSQELNADGYPTSTSTLPNVEDINQDNTLDNLESYFQYKVKLTPQDFNPSNIGTNYITDMLEAQVTTKNGELRTIRWYQVKIPVRDPARQRVGNITDLRSVRFMRMFLTGFSQPVVLRFARLELIRGEWRKFLDKLDTRPEGFANDQTTEFNISAVNIEENSQKSPVNYVLPPDINRELQLGTTNLTRVNEQSLALNFCNLPDGEAIAAYRNLDLDMINYGNIQMYVHAESKEQEAPIMDGDLKLFIRMGADFEENYYEYEIPLAVTPPRQYNAELERDQVWPYYNNIDLPLSELTAAKIKRNDLLTNDNRLYQNRQRNATPYGNGNIYVVGNPNLSDIKSIMIGVRNPHQEPGSLTDDGQSKCGEIWVNEFRLTDFDESTGWAAIGRVSSRLADLATVNVSGNISTPGFGSIEKKVSERQRETIKQVDASANIELGKFFPEKTKINIPMYVGYSRNSITPQFSPIEQDVTFDEALESRQTAEEREQLRESTQTLTTRKSINFTNVRKGKTNEGISTPLDISNFSVSYSYQEELQSSFNIERDLKKTYRGGLSYNYAPQSPNIKPFSKIKYLRKSDYYKLFRDMNFFLLPQQVGFRTDFTRSYNERQIRNNNPGILADLPPFFNKNFTWSRIYNFKWDLSRNLKFDFNANNQSLIDEPQGIVNKEVDKDGYEIWRDSVLTNIRKFGTPLTYQHASNLTYNMPINKVPALDWINSDIRYSSTYNWQRAPFAADTLGNTIQNSSKVSINGRFNLTSLYNKVPYFKTVVQKQRRAQRSSGKNQRAARNTKEAEEGEKVKRDKLNVLDHSVLFLMALKNVSITYSETRGTLLPGYNKSVFALGMDNQFEGPGVGFIFGQQSNFGGTDTTFQGWAAQKDWLVKQENLNSYVSNTFSEDLNITASLEPIKDLRINLTASKNQAFNNQEFFRWNDTLFFNDGSFNPNGGFVSESPIQTGNFSSTFSAWRTAFIPSNVNKSLVFEKFLENRQIISQRLADENASSNGQHSSDAGYAEGYGQTQQDVLIPAFMAAYSGTPIGIAGTSPFIKIPKLNWRVTYNGLSKIPALKEYFESVNLNHAYRATFQMGGFTSNLLFQDNGDGFPAAFDLNQNYIPEYQINTVSISENFSPLVNFDMTWKNSLLTKIEFNRNRTVSLNMANTQITEDRGNEYVIGAGYRFKDVVLPFQLASGKKLQSDLRTRADFSVRDNRTIIRKIVENQYQETGGQWVFTIKISADYEVSKQLNIRLFFDRVANKPVLSRSFPNSNTNAGISLRFTLS